MLKLYGKYLTEVLQDRENGETILSKADAYLNEKNNKLKNFMFSIEDITADSLPCIVISVEQEKFGLI